MIVDLSLVSHTNVGKTTLARTLLRSDIGEIADRAHVTELTEAHTLIETPEGDALRLWDTPGFGDSARLLKRLKASGNPLGWFLSQVWDRLVDRPFWSSQQAIRNVRDTSDVVLYLVNAAEDPASAGYVEAEMQILGWLEKPVVLLLNQVGPPRGAAADAAEADTWRRHLSAYPWVRGALGLDAFARCWVQEDALLALVRDVVRDEQRAAVERLRAAWRDRNLAIFAASAAAIAGQLAAAATDSEPTSPRSLGDRARSWVASVAVGARVGNGQRDVEGDRAMAELAKRADRRVRETTDELIRLHGLSGRAAAEVLARVAGQFDVDARADPGKAGLIGGVVSGALGGLAADLAAGGLTFGAGALIGGVLGALGAGGAAKAYNVARGGDQGTVRWSPRFLDERLVAAALRYLAVAHFGRGRGDFVQGEYPAHWRGLAEEAVAPWSERLSELWHDAAAAAGRVGASAAGDRAAAGDRGDARDRVAVGDGATPGDRAAQGDRAETAIVAAELREIVEAVLRDALIRLYPEAEGIFTASVPVDAACQSRRAVPSD